MSDSLFTDQVTDRTVKFPFRMSQGERQALGELARELGLSPTRTIRRALQLLRGQAAPQEQRKGKR